ncbi:MAG: PAS domain-containing protein, partial [Pseudomonadota bacterium]
WTALRCNGDIPNRSDIDPRGLENILDYTFILERIAPGIARIRLAGRHLCAVAGMEVRGMPLTAFFTGNARSEISAALEHMFTSPAVVELELQTEKQLMSRPIQARMILLPLRDDNGQINRALGVLMADGTGGTKPNRFQITGSSLRDLTNSPPAISRQSAHRAIPVPGFAEPAAGFDGSHLRLVVSRD